jgi:hypothetical protein
MNDYQLEDMLDTQSRALRDSRSAGAVPGHAGGSQPQPSVDLAGLGDVALTLAPLLLLAQDIAAMLLPLAPRADYRRALHRSLIKQARRQQALGLLDLPEPIHSPFVPEAQPLPNRVAGWLTQETASLDMDRRWVLGAAAFGSAVSLAGILAYVLSHRGRPAASA